MTHRSFVPWIVGTGLVCVVFPMAASLAQDRGNAQDSGSAEKIDKAIQAYQDRAAQELEQTRKELERMRKELGELIEMRFDMAVAAAELRAETGAAAGGPGFDPFAAGRVSSGGGGQAARGSEREGQNRRATALNQELRQVQELLRREIQEARNGTDQLVAQLREMRAQQRQRQEQMKADQERAKAGENPSGGPGGGQRPGQGPK